MTRSIIGLVLVGLLAGAALAQPGDPDPRDDAIAADRAAELLQRAEIAMKRHDAEEAEKLLHRAIEIDAPGDVGRRVFFHYVEFLVQKGDPKKALEVLRLFGENRTLHEEVAAQVAEIKHAVEATIEAKKLRARAVQARLNALKADLAAERAEARAHLLLQGTEPEEVEKHLAELDARHARRLQEIHDELDAWRESHPRQPADRARSALERLLRAQGRTPDEATEEAEERMRAVDEARKQFEEFEAERARLEKALAEAQRDLEKVERAHQTELERRRLRPGRGPGPGRRLTTLGEHFFERRLEALEQELAKAETEKRPEDANRLRAEIQELMRDAALRSFGRDARAARGRDGLEDRVAKIENEVREIRRLVERLLEKK